MTSGVSILAAGPGFLVGLMAGACHFASLYWNARLFAAGRAGAALALQAIRIMLIAVLFYALAHLGAFALIAALAGLVLTRAIVIHRMERAR